MTTPLGSTNSAIDQTNATPAGAEMAPKKPAQEAFNVEKTIGIAAAVALVLYVAAMCHQWQNMPLEEPAKAQPVRPTASVFGGARARHARDQQPLQSAAAIVAQAREALHFAIRAPRASARAPRLY